MSHSPRLLLFLATLFLFACRPDSHETPTDYPDNVAKVFKERKCMDCHNGKRMEGGLNMENWSALMGGSASGASVVPYRTDWSHLLWHSNTYPELGAVAKPSMPYREVANGFAFDSLNKLTETEVQLLKDWVAAGAPNKNGEVKWQDRESAPGGKCFFLNMGADQLSVLDPETNLQMRLFDIGQRAGGLSEAPHFLAVSPDKQFIYITFLDGEMVEKYRADNYQFVARTQFIGANPAHVKISGDGKWAIVTHWTTGAASGTRKLTLLNTENMTVADYIDAPFGARPHGLAITQDFTTAYIANTDGNYITRIKIDPVLGKFKRGIDDIADLAVRPELTPEPTLQYSPYQCLLNDAETRLYVSCKASNEIYCYDVSNNQFTLLSVVGGSTQECPQGVGASPRLMVLHNNKLYVACQTAVCANSANRSRQGCISVIDVYNDLNKWVFNVYGCGHRPHGLAVDKQRNKLFVTVENQGTGTEPPHHDTGDGSPGQYNVVNLLNHQVEYSIPPETPSFPSAAIFIE